MTVSTETSAVVYEGNGLTSTFPFTFPIFARTHLVVTHIASDGTETVLAENTNYTLTWTGARQTGSVNRIQIILGVPTAFPLPTGESLRIERIVPLKQEQDLVNNTRIRIDQVEDGLDYVTQITQQLDRTVDAADHAAAHAPGGTGALPWTTIHGRGLASARPTAASTNAGYIYFSTDTGTLERSNGTTWETYVPAGATGPQGPAGPPGASDHGGLTGLSDDDHTQYHNDSRGDARYTPIAHAGLTTTAHGGIVADTDARLTDARTPTSHASSHLPNGSDPTAITNLRGPLSARPAASAANEGFQYETTDTGARNVTRSDGSAWNKLPLRHIDDEAINVKDYGATGDGVTDDYAAIVAAIAACPAGGLVYFPPGVYRSSSYINITKAIKLLGAGREVTTLRCDDVPFTATYSFINVIAFPFVMEDVHVDVNTSENMGVECYEAKTCEIRNCKFSNMTTRTAIYMAWGDFSGTDRGFVEIRGNIFEVGTSAGGVTMVSSSDGSLYGNIQGIIIADNTFSDVGSTALAIANNSPTAAFKFGTFSGCIITGNTFAMNDTGTYYAIPAEIIGHDDLVVQNNIVYGASRGLGLGSVRGGSYVGNIITGQFRYACEIGRCSNVLFQGNTITDCASFVFNTGGSPGDECINITIIGNSIDGGNNEENLGSVCIGTTSGMVVTGWKIIGNTIKNFNYGRYVLDFPGSAGSGGIIVSGNTYAVDNELAAFSFYSGRGDGDVIRDNTVLISADLTASNYQVANSQPCVVFSYNTATAANTIFRSNVVKFTGTVSSGDFTAMGAISSAASNAGMVFEDNVFEGAYSTTLSIPNTSADCVVRNNDITRATGTLSLNAAVVRRMLVQDFSSTAAPTWTSTRGDVSHNSSFAVGGIGLWKLTTSDTWVPVYFPLNDAAAGTERSYNFYTASSLRWRIICSSNAESGGNVGSRLLFGAYSDAGALIDYPIQVTARDQSTRQIYYGARYVSCNNPHASGLEVTYNAQTGQNVLMGFLENNVVRWRVVKVGSTLNFELRAHDSGGSLIDTPLTVLNASGGAMTIARPLTTSSARTLKVTAITSAAGTTAVAATDDVVVVTGTTTHTLTLVACATGRRLILKNRSTGTVTVNRAGSDTIDGATAYSLLAGQSITLVGNGTDWVIV